MNTDSRSFEPDFEITSEDRDGLRWIVLVGELDLGTAERVEQELRRVEEAGSSALVLDLSGLTFIDSTGLRLVIETGTKARERGQALSIIRGPDAVQRVFELTRTVDQLPFRAPN